MSKSLRDRIISLEQENRLLTENLVDSIWIVDAETLRYEYAAPPVGKKSVYAGQELVGKSIFGELTPESSKRATALLRTAIQSFKRGERTSESLELEMVHKNGDTFWVEIRAKLLKEQDIPLKIVGITRDISAQKKAKLQLESMNQKLVEALSEKEKLLKEIKVLRKLLPICSSCKRIRDDHGKWWPIEAYVRKHTDSDFTHTICPQCRDLLYSELSK